MTSRPHRPSTPRLAPVSSHTDDVAELLKGGLQAPNGQYLNIFTTMAHHPKLLKRFLPFGGFFLNKGLIPAREREIVILRVGHNTSSVYEFGQHTVIGKRCGLTDDEIAATTLNVNAHDWSSRDTTLLLMTDEICRDNCVSDSTWAALQSDWSEAELCELVVLVGEYRMVAGFLNTMGVQLDPDTPGWPA